MDQEASDSFTGRSSTASSGSAFKSLLLLAPSGEEAPGLTPGTLFDEQAPVPAVIFAASCIRLGVSKQFSVDAR